MFGEWTEAQQVTPLSDCEVWGYEAAHTVLIPKVCNPTLPPSNVLVSIMF